MGIGMCIEERKRHCYDSNELFGSKVLNLQNNSKNVNFKHFRYCYSKDIDVQQKKKKIKKLKRRIDRLQNELNNSN